MRVIVRLRDGSVRQYEVSTDSHEVAISLTAAELLKNFEFPQTVLALIPGGKK